MYIIKIINIYNKKDTDLICDKFIIFRHVRNYFTSLHIKHRLNNEKKIYKCKHLSITCCESSTNFKN